MTNELLIALISAFVAALVTLSSVYLTNRNNYKNLRLRLLSENSFKIFETHQKKLEELFLLLQNWETVFSNFYLRHSSAIKGEVTMKEAWDSIIEQGKEYNFDVKKIEMLVYVYFQELREGYDIILEKSKAVNSIVNKYEKEFPNEKIKILELFKEYTSANLLLFTQIKNFKEEILLYSKNNLNKINAVV